MHVSAVQSEGVPTASRARTEKQYVEPGDPGNVALVAAIWPRHGTYEPKLPFQAARR